MFDVTFSVNAYVVLSGDDVAVGHNDDSVCLQILEDEATYMSITEAEMLIAALKVAIENVGV